MKRVFLLVAGSFREGHSADLEGRTGHWSVSKEPRPAPPPKAMWLQTVAPAQAPLSPKQSKGDAHSSH